MERLLMWSRAQAPTPANGKVTRFHDVDAGGALTLKFSDGTFAVVGSGSAGFSMPQNGITSNDIGKLAMIGADGKASVYQKSPAQTGKGGRKRITVNSVTQREYADDSYFCFSNLNIGALQNGSKITIAIPGWSETVDFTIVPNGTVAQLGEIENGTDPQSLADNFMDAFSDNNCVFLQQYNGAYTAIFDADTLTMKIYMKNAPPFWFNVDFSNGNFPFLFLKDSTGRIQTVFQFLRNEMFLFNSNQSFLNITGVGENGSSFNAQIQPNQWRSYNGMSAWEVCKSPDQEANYLVSYIKYLLGNSGIEGVTLEYHDSNDFDILTSSGDAYVTIKAGKDINYSIEESEKMLLNKVSAPTKYAIGKIVGVSDKSVTLSAQPIDTFRCNSIIYVPNEYYDIDRYGVLRNPEALLQMLLVADDDGCVKSMADIVASGEFPKNDLYASLLSYRYAIVGVALTSANVGDDVVCLTFGREFSILLGQVTSSGFVEQILDFITELVNSIGL